jgi:hypothetical protein
MPEDGPLDLGDKIVWLKNGAVHRADGPAIEFKDGRKLWAINGKEVTEQELAVYRQENERQARELADKMCQSHAEQIGQSFHKGLDHAITVSRPRERKKKPADKA